MIRDHQRAILAEKHVQAVSKGNGVKDPKAYGAVCMKLPILVHQAGLAPALHHVAQLSKSDKHAILEHLAEQLREAGLLKDANSQALLRHTREVSTAGLLTTAREVQRCLTWYSRFARTILKVESGEEA